MDEEYLEGYRDGLLSCDEDLQAVYSECAAYKAALDRIASMWVYTEAGFVALSTLQPYRGVTLH